MAKKKFVISGLLGTEDIKQKIIILPELHELIPPLSTDEFYQLKYNIEEEGCREPLIVWKRAEDEYVLIDGHNRYEICRGLRKDFEIIIKEFADITAAQEWMINNQMGRRNLTDEQRSYLRGKRYSLEKKDKGGYDKYLSKGQNNPLTAEKLAEEFNVSGKTIRRDEHFARGIDFIGTLNPELKNKILAGEVKVNKSTIESLSGFEPYAHERLDTAADIVKLSKLLNEKREYFMSKERIELEETIESCNRYLRKCIREPDKKNFNDLRNKIDYLEQLLCKSKVENQKN